MRLSNNWKDYELIDTSSGERLERWGDVILIRPDPQIIWSTEKRNPLLWQRYPSRQLVLQTSDPEAGYGSGHPFL